MTYLDDGEAQHRCGDVADPHAGEHGDEHARQQDVSRDRPCFAQDECCHHFGNVVFGQRGGDGEAA